MKQEGMTKLSSGITVVRELENGVLKIKAENYHKQTIKRLIPCRVGVQKTSMVD